MKVTRADIEEHVNRLLVENFEMDPGDLDPRADIFDDLGLDSLDAIDLLLAMETFVGCRLDDDDKQNAKKIRTIDDVVVFVQAIATRSAGV